MQPNGSRQNLPSPGAFTLYTIFASARALAAESAIVKWLCFLPLVLAYFQVIRILSDYGICWVLSEGHWRPQTVAWGFPNSVEALSRMFDWRLFEYAPRFSRPLASLFELVDPPFRAMLWQVIPPHPSLSLTWIASLLLCPLLLFGVLRHLRISSPIAVLATAVFVANPGVISLEVLLFRGAKPLAICAILLCLWLAGIQNTLLEDGSDKDSRATLRFVALCLTTFICQFVDEVIIIVYPALALLFPRIVFRTKGTMVAFALMPIVYAVSVLTILPRIAELAGYPVPATAFGPSTSIAELLMFGTPASAYLITAQNIYDNGRLILADTFGLIDPTIPNSPLYSVYFFVLIALGGSYVAWSLYRMVSGFGTARPAALLIRALIVLAITLTFEGLLMTISIGNVVLRAWGLYYYGVFCVIFVLIAISLLVETVKPPLPLAALLTLTIVAATTFIVPATSKSYKAFHYYRLPPAPLDLQYMFQNKINRFSIPAPDAALLYEKTLEIWHTRGTRKPVQDVPVELSYVLYELGLARAPIGCEFRTTKFDLVWNVWGDAKTVCHN